MVFSFFVFVCSSTHLSGSTPLPEKLPGIRQEIENGKGNLSIQKIPQASGGRLVGEYRPGKSTELAFKVSRPTQNARFYLRYNNAMGDLGYVDVEVSSPGLNPAKTARLTQVRSPRWTTFRWASLTLGRLDAGTHTVSLQCPPGLACGELDVAVLLDDQWNGLYEPPGQFDGKGPVGTGSLRLVYTTQWIGKTCEGAEENGEGRWVQNFARGSR